MDAGSPRLYINGREIVFSPGVVVDINLTCKCGRRVKVRAEMTSEPAMEFGTFHDGKECKWYRRTPPHQVIADLGGDIVRGGPQ